MRNKKTARAWAASTWVVENWTNKIVPHGVGSGKVVADGN